MKSVAWVGIMVAMVCGCRDIGGIRTEADRPTPEAPSKMETLSFYLPNHEPGCYLEGYRAKNPSLPEEEQEQLRKEADKSLVLGFINLSKYLGVTWPKGSHAEADSDTQTIKVTNTAENLLKLVKNRTVWKGPIETDARFIEADRTTLDALGLTTTTRVEDADAILEELLKRDDARLLEAFHFISRNGQETVAKKVIRYRYPTEFEIIADTTASASNAVPDSMRAMAVEPQNFEEKEVGVQIQLVSELYEDTSLINIMLTAEVVGEPVWKDYGMKAPHPKTGTYDLPMEQPFFPSCSCSINTGMPIGRTVMVMMGGLSDEKEDRPGKAILLFLTLHANTGIGGAEVPITLHF